MMTPITVKLHGLVIILESCFQNKKNTISRVSEEMTSTNDFAQESLLENLHFTTGLTLVQTLSEIKSYVKLVSGAKPKIFTKNIQNLRDLAKTNKQICFDNNTSHIHSICMSFMKMLTF